MSPRGSYAKYACDACHARKASCTRDLPQCARCKAHEELTCVYSRSGILRRNRKRKTSDAGIPVRTVGKDGPSGREQGAELLTQAAVTERLEKLAGRKHASLRELAGLMGEYHGFWQDAGAIGRLGEEGNGEYYKFDEEVMRGWGKAMIIALQREGLLDKDHAPEEIVGDLMVSEPSKDGERAWWVVFYSVALKECGAAGEEDECTLKRVKGNLWLVFNDARFLLQPSILNVQALMVMVIFAESVLSPLASWTLISKACTMLLDLGVGTYSYIDPIVKRQRDTLFWRLSSMDKSLSIILSKTPVFQRELIKRVPLPSLENLLSTRPRYPTDGMPVLFEAHYEQQMAFLSRIQMNVWHCLPGQETHNVPSVRSELKTWYTHAKQVLEASALVEKPLLSASGLASIDLRLTTLLVHFSFLDILLTITSKDLRPQCVGPAQGLLGVLPELGELLSTHSELPSCLLWEWIHYPMIAFGKLWGQILSRGVGEGKQDEKVLEDLHAVPAFLSRLEHRHPMVAKLKVIAEKIIHHVDLIYHSGVATSSTHETGAVDVPTSEEHPDEHFDMPSASTEATFDGSFDDLPPLPNDFLFDPGFDWFAWGEQIL